jgi:hypothetical protein
MSVLKNSVCAQNWPNSLVVTEASGLASARFFPCVHASDKAALSHIKIRGPVRERCQPGLHVQSSFVA